MNPKSKSKKILGLILLILAITFVGYNIVRVTAEEISVPVDSATDEGTSASSKKKCSELYDEVALVKRYNVKIDSQGDNKYKLSIDPKLEGSKKTLEKLQAVEFKVVKINDEPYNDNVVISYKKAKVLTIPKANGLTYVNGESYNGISVTIEAVSETSDPKCVGKRTITLSLEINESRRDTVDLGGGADTDVVTSSQTLNCDGDWASRYSNDKFVYNFCKAKVNAKTKLTLNENETAASKLANFQCDINQFWKTSELEKDYYKDETDGYNFNGKIISNTRYLYASKITSSKSSGAYTYHFAPGNTKTGEIPSCKIKCEESVTVEYGPPVASKGGLCFEYKVQVTSRVSCGMTEKPKAPEGKAHVCTPAPICTNARGSYYVNQGGPNEDFDKCVKKCDGGKYSTKCTNKCYKEVYGTSSSVKSVSTNTNNTASKTANTSLQYCFNNVTSGNGCYSYSNGKIVWNSKSGNVEGRWYNNHWTSRFSKSNYTLDSSGFWRHVYSNGTLCNDNCWWDASACKISKDSNSPSDNDYLNPGIAEKDFEKNMELYKQVVEKCKAAAKCSTKTGEFTISVDYTESGSKTSTTINYPYTSSNDGVDKVSTKEVKDSYINTSKNKNTTILKSDANIDNHYNCYKSGSGALDAYQVEWSFPGTWINNKTGEISYVDKSKDESWRTIPNKFCIPLNAKSVNVTWWNTYFATLLKGTDSSINTEESINKCGSLVNKEVKDVKYNIHAETKEFGYFGWHIKVDCFYALSTSLPTNENQCKVGGSKARAVDLNNLFPKEDGSSIESPDQSGRTPGFNWSKYADTSTLKDSNGNNINGFASISPVDYMTQVQTLGNKVYDKQYLDYQFELTPDTIKQIREITKKNGKNYSSYTGDSKISSSGVTRYRSDLFRNNSKVTFKNVQAPQTETALDCNNMVNYSVGNACSS